MGISKRANFRPHLKSQNILTVRSLFQLILTKILVLKKNVQNTKITKKSKKIENELKRKEQEEQELLQKLKEEKIKARPPPIVTLDSLVHNSLTKFYGDSSPETNNDDAMDFVKNLIAEDEEEKQVIDLENTQNDQTIVYNTTIDDTTNPIEQLEEAPQMDKSEKPPLNIHSTIEVIERNKQKLAEEEEKTTVDLVINQKSMKKFKAIIPSKNPRNKMEFAKTQKEGDMSAYHSMLGRKNLSSSSLHQNIPPSEAKSTHEYMEDHSQKKYSQGSKPGSRNSRGNYTHEEPYTQKPTGTMTLSKSSVLQQRLNKHRDNSRRRLRMNKNNEDNTPYNPQPVQRKAQTVIHHTNIAT